MQALIFTKIVLNHPHRQSKQLNIILPGHLSDKQAVGMLVMKGLLHLATLVYKQRYVRTMNFIIE